MPLNFSGREETQKQQEQLLQVSNRKAVENRRRGCDLGKHQTPGSADSDLILSHEEHNKSEDELSLEGQSHAYISEVEEDSVETTALRSTREESKPLRNSVDADNYTTVSGTIKRGKKKGQSVEVILNMSREELEVLEANMTRKNGCPCTMTNKNGFHVLLWTIFCFPISLIVSGAYSFYMGTTTWYNVFKYFSENRSLVYRVLLPPLLVILYPFLILSVSLGLGLYAGVKQLSCCWDSWKKEFTDYEKGFFGWLCDALDVPECCPYEVVILSAIQKP